jgi:hypothetical protein
MSEDIHTNIEDALLNPKSVFRVIVPETFNQSCDGYFYRFPLLDELLVESSHKAATQKSGEL